MILHITLARGRRTKNEFAGADNALLLASLLHWGVGDSQNTRIASKAMTSHNKQIDSQVVVTTVHRNKLFPAVDGSVLHRAWVEPHTESIASTLAQLISDERSTDMVSSSRNEDQRLRDS